MGHHSHDDENGSTQFSLRWKFPLNIFLKTEILSTSLFPCIFFFSVGAVYYTNKKKKSHHTCDHVHTGAQMQNKYKYFLSILSSPSNGLLIWKRVMQQKLLSKMLGAHVDEGFESGNRTTSPSQQTFISDLTMSQNQLFLCPMCFKSGGGGRQTKKYQFLSTVWILLRETDFLFQTFLRGNPCVFPVLSFCISQLPIVRKSSPFLHTPKKYPKVRFCGRGKGGKGKFFRHHSNGGFAAWEEEGAWKGKSRVGPTTLHSPCSELSQHKSCQAGKRGVGNWELGRERRRRLLLLLWRRRDGTDVHSPPLESIKFDN